jgi:hypothetical protein
MRPTLFISLLCLMPDDFTYCIFFKLARCGYTLRVTSQASYSPEYITPTQQKRDVFM